MNQFCYNITHILFLFFILFCQNILSQYGPGGIGGHEEEIDNETPVNCLWLRAEDLADSLLHNQQVWNWQDISGYNHKAKFPSERNDLFHPLFEMNKINGFPWINFHGNGFLEIEDHAVLDGGKGIAVFAIVRRNSTTGKHEIVCKRKHWNWFSHVQNLSPEEVEHAYEFRFEYKEDPGDDNPYGAHLVANINGNYPNETEQIVFTDYLYGDTTINYLVDYVYNTSWGGLIRINGELTAKPDQLGVEPNPNPNVMVAGVLNSSANLYIGAANLEPPGNKGNESDENPNATEDGYLDGKIAEIIIYKGELDSTQMIIVENYLAAKYGLGFNEKEKYYHHSSFFHDIIGIGTINGYDVHSESYADAIGIMDNYASLDEPGEFVFAGHNGTPHGIIQNDLQDNLLETWARSYYIEKTGDIDAALSFDFRAAGLELDKSKIYKLFYRENLDSSFFAIENEGTVKFSIISFSLNNEQLKTGYYTLGVQADEPVILNNNNFYDIEIYPVPVSNYLSINNLIQKDGKIEIRDIYGRVILTKFISGQPKQVIDLSNLHCGVYTLIYSNAKNSFVKKLIKN